MPTATEWASASEPILAANAEALQKKIAEIREAWQAVEAWERKVPSRN